MVGTVYDMLPDAAKRALDRADVILAKGQGNYESLSGQSDIFSILFSVNAISSQKGFRFRSLPGFSCKEIDLREHRDTADFCSQYSLTPLWEQS